MNWPLEAGDQLGVMQERHEGNSGGGEKWPHSRDIENIESTQLSDWQQAHVREKQESHLIPGF